MGDSSDSNPLIGPVTTSMNRPNNPDACESFRIGGESSSDSTTSANNIDFSVKGSYAAVGLFILVFAVNVCTIGLFGVHWAYLAANGPVQSRRDSFYHFLSYLAAAGLLSLGIWCRSDGSGVLPCPSGEEMSRSCLYGTQPGLYQFIYTLHFFGLGWIILHFLIDLLHLPTWCLDLWQGHGSLSMFYGPCGCGYGSLTCGAGGTRRAIGDGSSSSSSSSSTGRISRHEDVNGDGGVVNTDGTADTALPPNILATHLQTCQKAIKHSFNFFAWLLLMWVFVTLTWTVFFDWSTGAARGVQGLAAVEVLQIIGYYVLICAYYRWC